MTCLSVCLSVCLSKAYAIFQADGYTGKADGSLGTFQQDMAILKFSNANFPQENIIDLASGTDGDFVGDKVTISGWGKTEGKNGVLIELILETCSNTMIPCLHLI